MTFDPVEVGKKIKEARKAKGLNQTEFGKRIFKSLRTVQKYESGEILPSYDMLVRIGIVLGVSLDQLIGYERAKIQLASISDFIWVLFELSQKEEIGFEIDVNGEINDENLSCSIRFNAKDGLHNRRICALLSDFKYQQEFFENEEWLPDDFLEDWAKDRAISNEYLRLTDSSGKSENDPYEAYRRQETASDRKEV